jgi:hypothetical protein
MKFKIFIFVLMVLVLSSVCFAVGFFCGKLEGKKSTNLNDYSEIPDKAQQLVLSNTQDIVDKDKIKDLSLSNRQKEPKEPTCSNRPKKLSNPVKLDEKINTKPCDLINQKSVKSLLSKLESDDIQEVLEAIKFFGEFGSSETQGILDQYLSLVMEPEIRATAIQAINWNGRNNELYDLFKGETDPDVQSAIIISADLTEMDSTQRSNFNLAFLNSLTVEKDPQVIANMLTYIEDQTPEQLLDTFSMLLERRDLDLETFQFMKSMADQSNSFKSLSIGETKKINNKLNELIGNNAEGSTDVKELSKEN